MSLTLGQLKQIVDVLAEHHGPDTPVLLSIDPEGNGFRPVDGVDEGIWKPEDREYVSHPDDIGDTPTNAVCLW